MQKESPLKLHERALRVVGVGYKQTTSVELTCHDASLVLVSIIPAGLILCLGIFV